MYFDMDPLSTNILLHVKPPRPWRDLARSHMPLAPERWHVPIRAAMGESPDSHHAVSSAAAPSLSSSPPHRPTADDGDQGSFFSSAAGSMIPQPSSKSNPVAPVSSAVLKSS